MLGTRRISEFKVFQVLEYLQTLLVDILNPKPAILPNPKLF
jgi:hypothetical protein